MRSRVASYASDQRLQGDSQGPVVRLVVLRHGAGPGIPVRAAAQANCAQPTGDAPHPPPRLPAAHQGICLASIFLDGLPTESVVRFVVEG